MKNKKLAIIILFVLLCVMLFFLFLLSKNINNNENEKAYENISSFEETDEIDRNVVTVECFPIETKYLTIEYPEKWKELIEVRINNNDPYTVGFVYNDKPLFDLIFNGISGFRLGYINLFGEVININVESYDVDINSLSTKEFNNYFAMQEDINVIISKLVEDYDLIITTNEVTPEYKENKSVFQIETEYCSISYPSKWKTLVNVGIYDDDIYTLKFSYKDNPLFNLTFNDGDGYKLGSMNIDGNDITIYLDSFDFDKDELSEQDYFNCCAMQEDVNVILEHLVEDYGFVYNLEG